MALTDSEPTQDAAGLSIVDQRLIQAGEVMRSAAGLPRLGILPAHTNALVTSLASMAYSVAAFVAIASRTGAGVEKLANNGATTVATTAAPGSNSRMDVIWFRPQFVASADAANVPLFGVTQGTAAAIPSKPSIPAGAVELATAVIPSTATTTQSSGVVITQTHLYTAMTGGTVVFRNDDEMVAFIPIAGTQGFRLDTKQMWSFDGSNWVLAQAGLLLIRPGNVAGGSVNADGTVFVNGGTSVRIDDCFSSRYRHYRIVVRAQLSEAANMRMNLTSGGVDRADNTYFAAAVYSPNFAGPNTNALNYFEGPTTNWFLQIVNSTKKLFAIDVYNPGMPTDTFASGTLSSFGGAVSHETWSGSFELPVANDGFRLPIVGSGFYSSMDIKIYAYA